MCAVVAFAACRSCNIGHTMHIRISLKIYIDWVKGTNCVCVCLWTFIWCWCYSNAMRWTRAGSVFPSDCDPFDSERTYISRVASNLFTLRFLCHFFFLLLFCSAHEIARSRCLCVCFLLFTLPKKKNFECFHVQTQRYFFVINGFFYFFGQILKEHLNSNNESSANLYSLVFIAGK